MPRLNKISIILLILSLITYRSNGQNLIDLHTAIKIALNNNLRIQQAKLNELSAEQELTAIKQSLLPTLNLNSTGNLNLGRSLDVTSYQYVTQKTISSSELLATTVPLFNGRQKINQIRQNEFIIDVNKTTIEKVKDDLVLNVVLEFLNLLNYYDQQKVADQQLSIAKEQLEYEKKNLKSGKKMLADLNRIEYQISKAEVNLSNIENNLKNEKVVFNQLLNVAPNTNFELEAPKEEIDSELTLGVDSVYKSALKWIPEIKTAELNIKAARQQILIAKGKYYPSISFSAGMASTFSRTPGLVSFFPTPQESFFLQFHRNLYEYFTFSVNIPILNGFNARNAVKKAQLDLRNSSLNEDIAKQDLYKVVNQAVSDLVTAKENYNSAQQLLVFAAETYRVIEKRYKSGLTNSLDLEQAQNDKNSAEFNLIKSKYDLIFKSKAVDFYTGKQVYY